MDSTEESGPSTAILAVVTIDPTKTVEELAAIPAEDPPPSWVTKLSHGLAMIPGAYSKSVDLSSNAAYQGGPIYLVCFSADEETALGAFGPLEIIE